MQSTKFLYLSLFLMHFYLANPLMAATPTISNVSGTIQTGQTLTITGTNMMDQNTSSWDSWHISHPNAWSFEGNNYASDGYYLSNMDSPGTITYDSNVKLFGSKSVRFTQSGAWSGPSKGAVSIWNDPHGDPNDIYIRSYVRYDASGGNNEWPKDHLKMFISGGGGLWYFQPAMNDGLPPTQMWMRANSIDNLGNIPGGGIKNGRWYCMEVHWKNSSPKRYEAWVDGVKIGDWDPGVGSLSAEFIEFGIVNLSGTTSQFNIKVWYDGFVVASSRVYPTSTIEVSNNPTYGQGTVKYQEPIYLSDTSNQIKLDLTGLGSGPYYLWVTNNRQERSQPYQLGGGDIIAPNPPSGLRITN